MDASSPLPVSLAEQPPLHCPYLHAGSQDEIMAVTFYVATREETRFGIMAIIPTTNISIAFKPCNGFLGALVLAY